MVNPSLYIKTLCLPDDKSLLKMKKILVYSLTRDI